MTWGSTTSRAGPGGSASCHSRQASTTAAQKLLIRMGPENQRRIQAKLEEFAEELGVR